MDFVEVNTCSTPSSISDMAGIDAVEDRARPACVKHLKDAEHGQAYRLGHRGRAEREHRADAGIARVPDKVFYALTWPAIGRRTLGAGRINDANTNTSYRPFLEISAPSWSEGTEKAEDQQPEACRFSHQQ